jgi:hypothetical protein
MKRMIVRIQGDDSGTDRIALEEIDADIANPDVMSAFGSIPLSPAVVQMGQGQLAPKVVSQAGRWLYDLLAKNSSVKQGLDLALAGGDDQFPIYIEIRSDHADELPWETLFSPNRSFLALDQRWPIARIASSKDDTKRYYFDPPVKIMVVLAATGVDATPEWDALWRVISTAKVATKVQVMLCQDSLKQQIDDLNNQSIAASYLEGAFDLRNAIESFDPNIIHFFCHGVTGSNPRLLLSTRSDWLKEKSSVEITPFDLGRINPATRNTWLVTLNCCLGAAPVAQAQSLARRLVMEGFPAAIGMRELVASTDAHTFCRGLYNLVLSELFKADTQSQVEICWPKLLFEARGRLATEHANGQAMPGAAEELKEWTLPVLYTKRQPFMIRGSSNNEKLTTEEKDKIQIKLNLVQQVRDEMAVTAAPWQVLQAFDAQILQLKNQLYPAAPPAAAPLAMFNPNL